MALSILEPLVITALKARAADGSTSATGYFQKGNITGVGAPAASVYRVTLPEAIDPSLTVIDVQNHTGQAGRISYAVISSTVIDVSTFNAAGAATDGDFSLVITQYR